MVTKWLLTRLAAILILLGWILLADLEDELADVTLTEGKFHQVKRMFAAVGHPVLKLERLMVAGIYLDKALEPGEWRELTEEELRELSRL